MPQQEFLTTRNMESGLIKALRRIVEVSVDDVEIRRAPTKHYVYVIFVSWSDGTVSIVYRRYEDFLLLEKIILREVRKNKLSGIPQLPGQKVLGRNNVQKVALKRLQLLYDYCKVLLSLPQVVWDTSRATRFFEPTDLDIRSTLKRPVMEEKRRDGKVHEISNPILEEKYIAVGDYKKTGEDQLGLKAGDSLQAFIRDDSGWWLVLNREGKHGWVPCSYLEKVDGVEEETTIKMPAGKAEKYMTLTDYDPAYPDEVGLEKGTVIEVLERTLDGWWLVRTALKEGRAPATNLAKADSLKVRQALQKATMPDSTVDLNALDFVAVIEDELNPRLSMFELDMEKEHDDYVDVWDDPNIREKIQTKRKPPTPQAQGGSVSSGATVASVKKILSLKRKTSTPPPRKMSIKREIVSINAARNDSINSDGEDTSALSRMDESNIRLEDKEDPSDSHDYYNVSPFEKKQSKKERPQFEARCMFKAGDSSETDLVEGEIIGVLEKTGTGWWLVQSQSGVGWVPSHFLKPLKNQKIERNISKQELPIESWTPRVPEHAKEKKPVGHIANIYLNGPSTEDTSHTKKLPGPAPISPKPQKTEANLRSPQSKTQPPVSPKPQRPAPLKKPMRQIAKNQVDDVKNSSSTSSSSFQNALAMFNKS